MTDHTDLIAELREHAASMIAHGIDDDTYARAADALEAQAARTAQIARGDVLSTSGAEARWIEDTENACTACGGSGHAGDNAREAIRAKHAAWSHASFGDVSAIGPAKHLSKEALEVASDPSDIMEHVDCQFLLWDMQRRAGFTDAEITAAMKIKMPILKARKYPPPKESEPREHDRTAPAPQERA